MLSPLELEPAAGPIAPEALQQELEELRYRLQIAEETLEAIRTGAVDALAVQENGKTRIFTLADAQQSYRVLVENMSEGAVTLNQQGLILYSNSLFASLVNLPLSEVIGSAFSRFLVPEYQRPFDQMFLSGWNQHAKGEFILQPVGQDSLHVHLSATTIGSQGDEVLGMIITDLSEQKELERLTQTKEELSRKNEELIRINDDLDTFVYTASHDLKNPVLNIEGLVTVLEEELKAPQICQESIGRILRMMGSSVARFKSTIMDLSDVAKVQKNFSSPPEEIHCREIFLAVAEDLADMIARAQARITWHIAEGQTLQFSKKNFQSIFYNLLSNAIKYASPDRQPDITISMEKQGNFMVLKVQDNGLGIDPKDSKKLFSMFERLHYHVEGSGVGLYIVKRIMDNAGGRIEVESEVGKGSTFSLYFPVPA